MPKKAPKDKTGIDPLHWDMILEGIHERSCVPFLGAAVNISSDSRSYSGLPMGPEVALGLIGAMLDQNITNVDELARVRSISPQLKERGLAEDLARLWLQNLPRVALHVQVKGADRHYLTGKLRGLLPEAKREPSYLLQVVAAMPFQLIITTNFDRLLERAIDAERDRWLAIKPEDFVDAKSLALKLRDGPDPLSQYLRAQLSPATLQQLDGYTGSGAPPPELSQAIAGELDALAHGASLYDEKRFAQVPLATGTRDLIDRNPAGLDLLRLNRTLVEEAYPSALRKTRKECKVIVQPVNGFSEMEGKQHEENPPTDDELVVYKLHGTFRDGAPHPAGDSGVVVTEEDYIQFLTVITKKLHGIPRHVADKFVNSTLLFLGYSLEDWDFRTLYQALIDPIPNRERRMAFAIQWQPPRFWKEYWGKKGVMIYDCDIYDFAEELERRYLERYHTLSASAAT